MNPGDVQRAVCAFVLADPATLAVPVHRVPTPKALGAEIVNVPVNDPVSVVPLIVPFQSDDAFAHVPVTVVPDWDSTISTAFAV